MINVDNALYGDMPYFLVEFKTTGTDLLHTTEGIEGVISMDGVPEEFLKDFLFQLLEQL